MTRVCRENDGRTCAISANAGQKRWTRLVYRWPSLSQQDDKSRSAKAVEGLSSSDNDDNRRQSNLATRYMWTVYIVDWNSSSLWRPLHCLFTVAACSADSWTTRSTTRSRAILRSTTTRRRLISTRKSWRFVGWSEQVRRASCWLVTVNCELWFVKHKASSVHRLLIAWFVVCDSDYKHNENYITYKLIKNATTTMYF